MYTAPLWECILLFHKITKRLDYGLDVRISTNVFAKLKDGELVKERQCVQLSIKERNIP